MCQAVDRLSEKQGLKQLREEDAKSESLVLDYVDGEFRMKTWSRFDNPDYA